MRADAEFRWRRVGTAGPFREVGCQVEGGACYKATLVLCELHGRRGRRRWRRQEGASLPLDG